MSILIDLHRRVTDVHPFCLSFQEQELVIAPELKSKVVKLKRNLQLVFDKNVKEIIATLKEMKADVIPDEVDTLESNEDASETEQGSEESFTSANETFRM